MKESIDLLDEIFRIDPSSRVLFTTFKYNQYFFEKHVFPRFRGKSLPLVLVDYAEYQNSLRESGTSRLAGTRYLVDSVLIPKGTFHPKIVIGCSDREIKLILSSANLTHAGFSTNAEICSVETIPFGRRNDFPIVHRICDFLSRLNTYVASVPHRQAIERLLTKIDSSAQSLPNEEDTFLLHNLEESILKQTRRIISHDVAKIIIVSPFFSQDLALYERLARTFTDNIEFVIQPGNNNLPVDLLKNWRRVSKARFMSIAFRDNRSLHGKLFVFRTKSCVFTLTGSANFTKQALLLSTKEEGNVEVCLLRRAPLKYFDYLFDPSFVTLKKIALPEVKPSIQTQPTEKESDFRILEAHIAGDKLLISIGLTFDHKMRVRIHIDRIEKDFVIETSSNSISLQLSQEDLQALATSAILSLTLEDEHRKLLSDLKLIHNPLYLPSQFSALSTIIDEGERTWLFRILNKYASLPDFNYVLPIIERMEEYGLLELKPVEKEELLLRLQARVAEIEPYSASNQIVRLIDRFRKRHEKRMTVAIESRDLKQLPAAINSFVMINKLLLWLVKRGLQDVDYLRFVRKNVESLLEHNYISLNDQNEIQIVRETMLLAHVVMLSYIVDYMQSRSPEFQHTSGKRNYLKDTFEETFTLALNFFRKASEGNLKKDLSATTGEYLEVIPEIDLDISTILDKMNRMITNVNGIPGKGYSFAHLQAGPET